MSQRAARNEVNAQVNVCLLYTSIEDRKRVDVLCAVTLNRKRQQGGRIHPTAAEHERLLLDGIRRTHRYTPLSWFGQMNL